MHVEQRGADLLVENIDGLDLARTLDCGQAFRWTQKDGIWSGVACRRLLRLRQTGRWILFFDTTPETFETVWKPYFDLDRDYINLLSPIAQDAKLFPIVAEGGIHILRQEPFEALCSFLISQNNHIPRIKGIIERLCENFGDPIPGGYAFPRPEQLAKCTTEDLDVIRSGFRAKYLLDAARKVASGQIDLESLRDLATDEARGQLLKIYGVGVKVADCTLWYGLGHLDAFPQDVWIKRILRERFGGEIPALPPDAAGIFQQYLFDYARKTGKESATA